MNAILQSLRESGRETALSVARVAAIVIGGFAANRVAFHPPTGTIFNGLATGTLYGLIGVSLILVYRTHRIINFAVAGIGAVPGISAVLLW